MRLPQEPRFRRLFAACLVGAPLALTMMAPAQALVRFGHGVYVGGHDFSHQTYGPGRRGEIYLSEQRPVHPGCKWVADRRGGKVKICHLQTIHRSKR